MAMPVTDPHTIYNAACTYGKLRRKANALSMLRKAVESGYGEWELASLDADLSCIRDEPEFGELMDAMRRRGRSR